MASSSRRQATRAWPFVLNWISREARPSDMAHRRLEEYISGIGMLQVNEERRLSGLPLLTHAMIITGIHESSSDPRPHLTLAAATEKMREQRQHIAVHSCVSSTEPSQACFVGSDAYWDNIRQDTKDMRRSYANPVQARTSLTSDSSDAAHVGCIANSSGVVQWYVLNDKQEMVYLESGKFYTIGQGPGAYLAFLHPILNKPCRAIFLGHERPKPHSPDPQPTNLEASMADLSIAPVPLPPASHQEWVEPFAQFGNDMEKPVWFRTNDGREVRTSWQSWERIDGQYVMFRFQGRGRFTGSEYWARDLPAEIVAPWMDPSSHRPVQFINSEQVIFKTKRSKWVVGMNSAFFVYLDKGVFYMALGLPSEDDQ